VVELQAAFHIDHAIKKSKNILRDAIQSVTTQVHYHVVNYEPIAMDGL